MYCNENKECKQRPEYQRGQRVKFITTHGPETRWFDDELSFAIDWTHPEVQAILDE